MPPQAAGIAFEDADGREVWRVGRFPDPWAWPDRAYAGRNRWDDPARVFRTVYAGDTPYACYVEVLAFARPDTPAGGSLLEAVAEDAEDAAEFPTPPAGSLPREWVAGRMLARARLRGRYADVRASSTIAALRPALLAAAGSAGQPDFDAAALKSSRPRDLTQAAAGLLYALPGPGGPACDGIRFASRHGDDLGLWAVFERPGDNPSSRLIAPDAASPVDPGDAALAAAMRLHGLRWANGPRPGAPASP